MAEVFLECTHSLTQQVKKKKEKKRTKPFGNQERERERLLPEFNCAQEKRIPAAAVVDARGERETVVVVLNCKTSNSKRADEDTEKLDDTITALVLAATGRDTNRWGDERSLRRLLMPEISPPRCGGQFSCLLLRVLSTSGQR